MLNSSTGPTRQENLPKRVRIMKPETTVAATPKKPAEKSKPENKPDRPTQTMTLKDGATVSFFLHHTNQTIFRKQKVNGQTVRDTAGKPVLYSMTVPGTSLRIVVEGRDLVENTISSRSCCKPPDNFCRKIGSRIALLNAFRTDVTKTILSKDDRKEIIQALFPDYYQEKKGKKKETKTVDSIPTVKVEDNTQKKRSPRKSANAVVVAPKLATTTPTNVQPKNPKKKDET